MNLSYERYLHDPKMRIYIEAAARRERAQALGRLLARLFAAFKPEPRELRPSRWLAVHGK